MIIWDYTKEVFLFLYGEPYRYGVIAVVGLTVLLFIARRLLNARRPIILYRGQGGDVEIARPTLRGLIVGAASRVVGVDHASCKYDQRGRKLRIQISIHLSGGARLKEVEDDLKKKIRNALLQQVGYEPNDVQPINVRVTKIIGDPAPVIEEEYLRDDDTLPRYEEPGDSLDIEGQRPFDKD